jgi:hypothetical protein
MFDFLDGTAATAKIRHLVESSQDVRLAVAFWGKGAASDISLERRAGHGAEDRPTQIICNLKSGGTNPDEIRRLINCGLNVKQCDTLHGKVYLFDGCFVLGSSNVSANGLALQGREVSGWHEANIVSDDPGIFDNLSVWVASLPTRKITDEDLIAARLIFNKRRQVLVRFWPKHINLFDAIVAWPERFRDKNIYITYYTGALNQVQLRDVNREDLLNENIGRQITGIDYELKMSSSYVGFCLNAERRAVTFDGYFRTRDHEWTNERQNRNRVWFCEVVDNIIGVRSRGPIQAWTRAVLAADADIAKGVIPDEPIEIGYFFDRYIKGNQELADAVTNARRKFPV